MGQKFNLKMVDLSSRNANAKIPFGETFSLIANYNNEVYLKKCLDSVLNQKYKKIEVIVVDDYSNDNSLNILNKYKNSIKIIKNKKKTKYGSLTISSLF